MSPAVKLAILGAFGALGTVARYGVYVTTERIFGNGFPLGTVIVNLVGALVFGVVWAATERWTQTGPEVRLLVLTGFMGAFTTFSTFASDVARLLSDGRWASAFANVALQNVGGVAAVMLGWGLGRISFS